MTSLENDGPVILTGPNMEVVKIFADMLPRIATNITERKLLESKSLLEMDMDTAGQVKCFLIMPRASRTLVYKDGDSSSMYQEIRHMCQYDDCNLVVDRCKRIIDVDCRFVVLAIT